MIPIDHGALHITPTPAERDRLRELAVKYMEIATSDRMKEIKRLWKVNQSLKSERPLLVFETYTIAGFIGPEDLKCVNPYLRNIEMWMVQWIKHITLVQDDVVINPYIRLPWYIVKGSYGVDIVEKHVEGSIAHLSTYPIQEPEDIKKLVKRNFYVDRERTIDFANTLRNIFGDILPVYIGGHDPLGANYGFNLWNGFAPLLTQIQFMMMGYENMCYWMYDYPDELKYVVDYLHDDNMRFLDFVEKEQLAVLNTDGVQVGAAGYGFCDDLPELTPETMEKPAALKDCWGVAESQESTVFSPDTFAEWFLPPIAEFANRFGHTSYGCCEPIHDRFDKISAAIHNLRTVSVTAWCDQEKALELLQNNYVYQRKPNPAFLTGPNPNWEAARKDLEFTRDLTKDQCSTQYLIRDVYDTAGDMNRAADWTRMAKEVFGI